MFPGGSDGNESACNAGDLGSIPRLGSSPRECQRTEWLPPPVFLPGEIHGQRSLVGYSPQGHRKSDTTERLTLLTFFHSTLETEHRISWLSFILKEGHE